MGRGYINGQDFDVDPYTIMSTVGTYEVWQISVAGGMDHPFHLHVNHAQVLSISGGDPAYASLYTQIPAWKDTIIVPKMGTITILVPIMDYTGMTMFHCHIVEHEDIGMMGMWHIMPAMEEMP
jgi:FtsP/CotA-like multicopper oxidase with cupredoxin domain